MRPFLSMRLKRFWAITASKASDRVERIWACSLRREDVDDAVHGLGRARVCRVPKTRWPVLAASRASSMVSRSRISPTRMMSGSSRSAPRRAAAKDLVWMPTSRWLMRQFLLSWTNSIGSSTVMMWSLRFLLASSMIAASVVDLPQPVGPVTRTRPRGQHGELLEHRRQPELLGRQDVVRNLAEDRADPVLLHEEVGAEAGQARDLVAEIDVAGFLEDLDLVLGGDLVEHGAQVVVVEDLVLDPLQLAADAQRRAAAPTPGAGRRRPCSYISLKKASIFAIGALQCLSVEGGLLVRSRRPVTSWPS